MPVSQAPQHENESHLDTESIVVNLGPHHPSTHGVFRMLTRVEGETILALEPEMGICTAITKRSVNATRG